MLSARIRWVVATLLALSGTALSYEQKISDTDDMRQVCSGMWANENTFINVTFDPISSGHLAILIYEFSDLQYLGKEVASDVPLPKTYICTSDALRSGLCTAAELGEFIVSLPPGVSQNQTSIWTASVSFASDSSSTPSPPSATTSSEFSEATKGSGLWDNPDGNPTPPSDGVNDDYTSPWRKRQASTLGAGVNSYRARQASKLGSSIVYDPAHPIHYPVKKLGYYCVGTVPITFLSGGATSTPNHATFKGTILFRNTFDGQLPAADYPKITLYLSLMLAYTVVGSAWAYLCFKHRQDLLPLQYYVSSLMGFLVIEMLASWAYYRYLNAHGLTGVTSKAFLFVVAILDAGRNALSFFLLLVVCLGLSLVRETLPMMTRCRVLAIAHFIFGVLYAIGMVEIDLETVSFVILLIFVLPLAFTMSAFLMWIMISLRGTMAELVARKQTYKFNMFKKLNYILLLAVAAIFIFFVVSSFAFSNRMDEDYASNSWQYRWLLMDGWLSIIYLFVFTNIAFLWRPTGNNRR